MRIEADSMLQNCYVLWITCTDLTLYIGPLAFVYANRATNEMIFQRSQAREHFTRLHWAHRPL